MPAASTEFKPSRSTLLTSALLSLLALLAGCASTSPQQESQVAPGVDLAGYSTFGWGNGAAAGTTDEPLRILDVSIRNAIRSEMTGRGYLQVESDPGLRIDYETIAQDKVKSSPFRIGIGLGSFGGNVGGGVNVGTPSVQSYVEGRLVIRAIDAASNNEVWYGTISGKADAQTLNADAVAKDVALAMESFPARAGAL